VVGDGDDGALPERVVDATDEVASSEREGRRRGWSSFIGEGGLVLGTKELCRSGRVGVGATEIRW
jgi:hypothetical protein